MLVLAMLDLDMLDTDMAILPTDTPPLDTMARGLLMLSLRLRLMLDSTIEDMDMVLDMLVLDIPDLDMLDTDMAILPMDTPPLDTMASGLLMPSLRIWIWSRLFWSWLCWIRIWISCLWSWISWILLWLDLYQNILTKQKLKVITGWHIVIQCPLMRCRNCYEQIFK